MEAVTALLLRSNPINGEECYAKGSRKGLLVFWLLAAVTVALLLVAPASSSAQVAGTAWAWGSNLEGYLGDGTNTDSNIPVRVSNLSGVKATAGGGSHSLALREDGTVWAWGWNGVGQLGNGTYTTSNIPVQVNNLSGVKAIAAGDAHSLALREDGTVWAWGYNLEGELGNGTNTHDQNTPVQVSNLSGVKAIAGGGSHSLALREDGTVWAWGYNGDGELGNGTNTDSNTPVQVHDPTGPTGFLQHVTAISAGGSINETNHSLALKEDGTVWAWGDNSFGQLGDGTNTASNTPVRVTTRSGDTLNGITAIAAGYEHSLALKEDGTVRAWGHNNHGQLGNGTKTNSKTAVKVKGLRQVKAIAAGSEHSLALKEDATVRTWGRNHVGQLGDGTNTDRKKPVKVKGLGGVKAIAGGAAHSLAAKQ